MFLSFSLQLQAEWVLTPYLSLLLKTSGPGPAVGLALYSFNMSGSMSSVRTGSWFVRSLAVLNNYNSE